MRFLGIQIRSEGDPCHWCLPENMLFSGHVVQAGNATFDGYIDNPREWLQCADSKHSFQCRYDAGGFNNLQQSDLDFEVDLSQLGMVNTAMAAMFSKLGEAFADWLPSLCSPCSCNVVWMCGFGVDWKPKLTYAT